MALFGRDGLDAETRQALAGIIGRRPRVLASGRSTEGQVLGTEGRLVYQQDGQWCQQPWHGIERGGWDPEARMLWWSDASGAHSELELTEAKRLPDLFNERVMASIAYTAVFELATKGTAVITARRDLADSGASLIWRVAPGKDVRAEDVYADPLVALELERLRSEYDLS